MLDYTHVENLSAADVERLKAVYEPLTRAVRELVDATIRTEVDADEVAAATAEIDSATSRLRAKQRDQSFGIQFGSDGDSMPWGNAPLGRVHAEARVTHTEGFKTYVVGHLGDDTGVTVEAEGVFIEPRWARD
ncbi:hypothetical protein [Mycolicibacterium pyrenivorans]|uniref:hypothetical protein n=1 Tax=Mycolicibacterium pyrenivorans TaxID=187102 RepID=UPI0021F331AC|nr:hypothetical protein [Mycolicibacterium pyrenivorans]MCV7153548.1 hypothetical protein [Mycolicibacterium pyrenivorans]